MQVTVLGLRTSNEYLAPDKCDSALSSSMEHKNQGTGSPMFSLVIVKLTQPVIRLDNGQRSYLELYVLLKSQGHI